MSIEYFEYMDTALTDYKEWLDHEQDMESNPFGDCSPTEEDLEQMRKEGEKKEYIIYPCDLNPTGECPKNCKDCTSCKNLNIEE